MSPFTSKALAIAALKVGVKEEPPGSNRGPEVDEFQRRVGLNPEGKYSWCAAFVYWCFDEAAKAMELQNPLVKTGGVLKHWNESKGLKILVADAKKAPETLPGTVFIMSFPGGLGHTGFVEAVDGSMIVTIEGNTSEGGSREGVGVFKRRRTIASAKGFIDYSDCVVPLIGDPRLDFDGKLVS